MLTEKQILTEIKLATQNRNAFFIVQYEVRAAKLDFHTNKAADNSLLFHIYNLAQTLEKLHKCIDDNCSFDIKDELEIDKISSVKKDFAFEVVANKLISLLKKLGDNDFYQTRIDALNIAKKEHSKLFVKYLKKS